MLLDERKVLLGLLTAAQDIRADHLHQKGVFSRAIRLKRAPTRRARVPMPIDEGLCRRMDIVLYALYSKDEKFLYDMVSRVMQEVSTLYEFAPIMALLEYNDRPVLFRCLFFLMLNFHTSFRFWLLSEAASQTNGLPPICEHKMCRFLMTLRDELVPNFLVHETVTMDEFDRSIKVAYIAS